MLRLETSTDIYRNVKLRKGLKTPLTRFYINDPWGPTGPVHQESVCFPWFATPGLRSAQGNWYGKDKELEDMFAVLLRYEKIDITDKLFIFTDQMWTHTNS